MAQPGRDSVPPTLMGERGRVQLLAAGTPLWQVLIHERDEAAVVVAFQQVHQLVDDDVLQALHRLLGQLQVDPDSARRRVAATPLGPHAFDAPSGRSHMK